MIPAHAVPWPNRSPLKVLGDPRLALSVDLDEDGVLDALDERMRARRYRCR
jgi:hypothetical protein